MSHLLNCEHCIFNQKLTSSIFNICMLLKSYHKSQTNEKEKRRKTAGYSSNYWINYELTDFYVFYYKSIYRRPIEATLCIKYHSNTIFPKFFVWTFLAFHNYEYHIFISIYLYSYLNHLQN